MIPKSPSAILWQETYGELLRRWLAVQPEEQRPTEDLDRIIVLTRDRAERMREYLEIAPARALKTPREWEVHWDPREQWNRLQGCARKFGWRLERLDGDPDRHSATLAAQAHDRENVAMIFLGPVLRLTARVQTASIPYEFHPEHMVVIEAAAELFNIGAARIGKPPKDTWMDDLAVTCFQHRVLGLPFHPLALRLV